MYSHGHMITPQHKLDHCRGELGRGKIHRCPKSWLITARKLAREQGDDNMVTACTLALVDWPYGPSDGTREIQRLAGRRLGPSKGEK